MRIINEAGAGEDEAVEGVEVPEIIKMTQRMTRMRFPPSPLTEVEVVLVVEAVEVGPRPMFLTLKGEE